MPKYEFSLFQNIPAYVSITVEAENEDAAYDIAYERAASEDFSAIMDVDLDKSDWEVILESDEDEEDEEDA